jgi:prepilin-type processing-associated H-X9-DG protein
VTGSSTTNGAWGGNNFFSTVAAYTEDGVTANGANSRCAINCSNNNAVYSFHTAGATVSFADGSVKFLAKAIDIPTFAALVTAAADDLPTGDY